MGIAAQDQRHFEQAEQYYQKALQIHGAYHDLYKQAIAHFNLGNVAMDQHHFEQAEQYYQQALQIYVEFNDRYGQANTYYQLGRVEEEQRQWPQALEYFLTGLEIDASYSDTYEIGIDLRSLARLWKTSGDAGVIAGVARVMQVPAKEAEKMLREALGEEEGKKRKSGKKK